MEAEQLTQQLLSDIGSVDVEQLNATTYRVLLPNFRHTHETVALGLIRHPDCWEISDGGQLSYLLDDDFSRVAELIECAGASFTLDGNNLSAVVEDETDLAGALITFAHYFTAAPTLWHALECQRPGSSKPASTDLMARETRSRVIEVLEPRLGPHVEHFVLLNHSVSGQGEKFPAPLAIAARHLRRRPPSLVASFIDTAAPPNSLTVAKRNASYLFHVTHEMDIPKYVVVRGESSAVEHYAEFYDTVNAVTVSTDDPARLYEDAADAINQVVRI